MLTARAKAPTKRTAKVTRVAKQKRKYVKVVRVHADVNDVFCDGKPYTGGRSILDFKPTKR